MFDAIARREAAAVALRLREAFGWADSVRGQEYWEQVCKQLSDIAEGRDCGPSPALAAYAAAMQSSGVPQEPLQVYDSNSWLRVGLVREYKEVMAPTVARDGQPDIRGIGVLVALVAAFNAMLELRSSNQP